MNNSGNRKNDRTGFNEDMTSATFIMRKDQLEKIRAVAYWDRKRIEDVLDEAVESYLNERKITGLKGKGYI